MRADCPPGDLLSYLQSESVDADNNQAEEYQSLCAMEEDLLRQVVQTRDILCTTLLGVLHWCLGVALMFWSCLTHIAKTRVVTWELARLFTIPWQA
jgi:hypothetical protein